MSTALPSMLPHVLYVEASGAIAGWGYCMSPADQATTASALPPGVALLAVPLSAYLQVARAPAEWKVSGGAVVAA